MADEKEIMCKIIDISEEGITECVTPEGKKVFIENPDPETLKIKFKNKEE